MKSSTGGIGIREPRGIVRVDLNCGGSLTQSLLSSAGNILIVRGD